MAIISGHDICLTPLIGSHNDADFGEQLKQLTSKVFVKLLGKQASRVNLSSVPWLSDIDQLRQLLHKDGISLLTNAADDQRVKHFYKAWIAKNGQGRGLHLLRLFLNLMYAGNTQVVALTVSQLYQDSTKSYPTALSKTPQVNSFLTSRILIDIVFTPDFSNSKQIEDSIKNIISARFLPIINTSYQDMQLEVNPTATIGLMGVMHDMRQLSSTFTAVVPDYSVMGVVITQT